MYGQLMALQLLRSYDIDRNKYVPTCAAMSGNTAIIEWAISNGCPISESASQYDDPTAGDDIVEFL